MWRDSDLLCIGELQLLWIDKNSEQMLASLRLYFLPENIPDGRHTDHGEDEVLAIQEKVVIRVEDLVTWITFEAEWNWGRLARCEEDVNIDEEKSAAPRGTIGASYSMTESTLDFSDVETERQQMIETDTEHYIKGPHVIILSFPKYCRYRAVMKRLEGVESQYLKCKIVNALGGFYVVHPNTRVLFCRDTFEYPDLECHEMLCNHLAPKLKGRPRGKRKKRSLSPGGSESNESESSVSNHYARATDKDKANGTRSDSPIATRRSMRCHENNENKQFMKTLSIFMKSKRIPMGRIPSLGFKELNLHEFFSKVQKLGGYDVVTLNKLWKSVYDEISGHQSNTSAATSIRRHYERFLLAYERHIKGEEYKPLPGSERRRLKSKRSSTCTSTSSMSDADSSNGDTTPPLSRQSSSPPSVIENKETVNNGKTSSLRSIRVKPERQKDKQLNADKFKPTIPTTVPTEPEKELPAPSTRVNLEVKQEPDSKNQETNNDTTPKSINENQKPDQNSDEVAVIKTEGDTENHIKLKVEEIDEKHDTNKDSEIVETTEEINEVPVVENNNQIKHVDIVIPEKDAEPLTSAVAPVVLPQKIPLEKTLSPVEGKENVPIVKTGEELASNADIKISSSPKLPETINIDVDSYKSSTTTTLLHQDVNKKIKLDILKECGLEVTAVSNNNNISVKPALIAPLLPANPRPSVIQPAATNILTPPAVMPPPSINSVPLKRPFTSISQPLSPFKPITPPPKRSKTNNSFSMFNCSTPPKVVQSKSIYCYSEKTVYGNPKDILQSGFGASVLPELYGQTPRHGSGVRNSRTAGGNPVDLTVPSPQKPMVEIMRIPQMSSSAYFAQSRENVTKNLYKTSPPSSGGGGNSNSSQVKSTSSVSSAAASVASSLLEGRRLGSNLEITLVRSKTPQDSGKMASVPAYPHSGRPTFKRHLSSDSNNSSSSSKSSKTRTDENGRYGHTRLIPTLPKSTMDLNVPTIPNPYMKSKSSKSTVDTSSSFSTKHQSTSSSLPSTSAQHQKTFLANNAVTLPPTLQPYLNQYQDNVAAANGLTSFMPLMDSLYYMQNLYSNNLNSVAPPILPIPTPEQLKFYAELMAHGRMAFPFQYPQTDGTGGFLNNGNGAGSKKP